MQQDTCSIVLYLVPETELFTFSGERDDSVRSPLTVMRVCDINRNMITINNVLN